MFTPSRAFLAVAAVACGVLPNATHASSCIHEIVVPIQFQAGKQCWRHSGVGTTFTGRFGAHQYVTAGAIGETFNSDGKRTWITAGPWQLSVSGPDRFFAMADSQGQLDTMLPRSGEYRFSIGPCAVWGNEGMIEICAQ
jgi:hypothetical protein